MTERPRVRTQREAADDRKQDRKHKLLRDNWYRDIWMLLVTGLVVWSLIGQAEDRKEAVNANVEARYSDCRGSNDTRTALRRQVETGKLERPFLLRVFPQLNTPEALALIEKNEREELKGFAGRNCVEVAEEALPGHHKRYTLSFSR